MVQSPMIYELRKPKEIDPEKSYPALFVLHGIGSNEQDMLSLVDGLEDTYYIFSIRGHLIQPPGFAYFTIQGFGKPHRDVFDVAVNKLLHFIDYACEAYPVDRNQVYLLGFSQGAILSMTLGLTLGDRIKGIVALSGYIPAFVKEEYKIKNVEQLSLFISHGELDQILPFEWGLANNELFNKLGANVTFKTYREGHTVAPNNLRDFRTWLETKAREEDL
ncbi:alpha/beta hydrolase [Metabacillus sediminilitoris]|uniref:Esterase n=1 Tax=Metabacillus sediminilitoris TaxID=2567941 RepID=A0A4S4BPG5_9BACI|nr:alpha/beta fold hydrolase [Metabacillus sediminilitoris]QGQ47694.1 esterase [Metabacillus sediminilitoris]THF76800.1 esterase [Metabacillus sediminilitoris]